jgi:chemotaxis signal transduction protein
MPKIILFQSENTHFAVDPTCVSDIHPASALGAMPETRQARQTIQYQGRALQLIDPAAFLNPGNPAPHPPEAKALMVKTLNGAPDMAIIADAVNGVMDAPEQKVTELPPVFTGTARQYFPTVVRLDQRLALVFNTSALVEPEPGGDLAPYREGAESGADLTPNPAAHPPLLKKSPQGATTIHLEGLEMLIEATIHKMVARRVQQAVAQAMNKALGALPQAHEDQSKKQKPPCTPTRPPQQAEAHAEPAAGHVLIFPARTPGVQGKQVYYLFSLRQVVDVLRQANPQPVPFSPGFAEGVSQWRGRVLPMLCLEHCLGMKTSDETIPLRTIVVRGVRLYNGDNGDNGHESRDFYAIFNVGAAVRQLKLPLACNPIPVPSWITNASALSGVYEMEQTILLVVNLEKILGGTQNHEPQNERLALGA